MEELFPVIVKAKLTKLTMLAEAMDRTFSFLCSHAEKVQSVLGVFRAVESFSQTHVLISAS